MSNKNLHKVNILLEGYDIDALWLYGDLKEYVSPESKVAIIAFSFRDEKVRSADDWEKLFSREQGCYYGGIVNSLKAYGLNEEQISFINYFSDSRESAAKKIENADILYFPGGLPDRMMERIKEFGLYDAILHHSGIFLGYSAGAVIQLKEYHLSPDKDYSEFSYYEGFPFIEDFYLEVHYQGTEEQNNSIERILFERKKPVYALEAFSGAIIVDNGKIKTIGKVKEFTNKRKTND
ncbi:MAG: Type 1 glutamine amidotransferase-like domain-containing protein [Oscillospiraceae bacterium]|nr:Type 1 glutamine amidotransferase-like domain-containing protein [Oscillospiraceae bacterium]